MKKINKKGISTVGIIFIIYFVIVMFIEIFIFNFNYFYYGEKAQILEDITFHNVELIENDNYRILENDAWLEINDINGYTNNLEFQTNFFNQNVYMNVEYNNKTQENYINVSSTKVIPIKDSVEKIKINFLDGKDQSLHLKNFYSTNFLEINVFRIGIMLLVFLAISLIFYGLLKKGGVRLEVIFIILILSFGSLNSLMTPLFHSLDEGEHYIKAYNLASGNFAMKKNEAIEYPKNFQEFLNRKYKSPNKNNEDTYPKYRTYAEFIDETKYLMQFDYEDTELVYFHSTAITYTDWPYVANGLGIFIGKILNLPVLISFYLGRIFNLIMYASIVFFAIKLIPIAKKLLFLCALVPTSVFLAGAYSADIMVNALTLLSFAVVIKWLIEKKKIRIYECVFLLGCFMLIIASKATYAPFFLMFLLLGKDNFSSKNNERLAKIGVGIIAIITFICVYYYGSLMGIAQWPIEGVDTTQQIINILSHPIRYLSIALQTLCSGFVNLLRAASTFVVYVGRLSEVSFYLIWIMLFSTAILDVGKASELIKIRDRGLIILACSLALVLSMTALYVSFTPVGASTIQGFQGRYIIPLIFPMLFLLQHKKWKLSIRENLLNQIVISFSTCMLLYTSIYIFIAFYK